MSRSIKEKLRNLAVHPLPACVFVFLMAFYFYTTNNKQPAYYHPDEELKAKQVTTGKFYFLHPALLLISAKGVAKSLRIDKEYQSYAITGRYVSAFFAAMSVVFLMLISFYHRGIIACWCVGLTTSLCPMLLVLSHYMKEDTALLFGISAFFLAICLYLQKQTTWRLVFFGIACALAVSGKYIGVIVMPIALLILFRRHSAVTKEKNRGKKAIFFLAFIIAFSGINYKIFENVTRFRYGLGLEMNHVVTHHQGLAMKRLGTFYPRVFVHQTLPPVLLLGFAYLLMALFSRKRFVLSEKITAFFAVYYFFVLWLFPLQMTRYLLPVVVWFYYMAGMALGTVFLYLPRKFKYVRVIVFSCLVIVVSSQLVRCLNFLDQFDNDSRKRLVFFASDQFKPNDVVLQDAYVALDKNKGATRCQAKIINVKFAGSFESLSNAKQEGITHIVVCELAYNRFFEPNTYPVKGFENFFNTNKGFYQELFEKGDLIWEAVPSVNIEAFTNPVIKVYRIPD